MCGVLGISLAYHLTKSSKKVVLLEKEASIANHASEKNAGMIRQLYRNPQLTEWTKRSIVDWPKKVKEKTFIETGSCVLGRKIPEHGKEVFIQKKIKPAESEIEYDAVFSPTDGLLEAKKYVLEIFKLIDSKYFSVKLNEEAKEIRKKNDNWTVITNSKKEYTTPWLVNAAGAWINSFLDLPQKVLAQPFARHLFVVDGWEKNFMPTKNCGFYWDEANGWYLRDWGKDRRLVSICDKVPADPDKYKSDPRVEEQVKNALATALPIISNSLSFKENWFCFRTYTDDQLPIWGEDPDFPGLFWLAAFGGFGMSTSFAATKDAADYIRGKNIAITKEFLPTRARPRKEMLSNS